MVKFVCLAVFLAISISSVQLQNLHPVLKGKYLGQTPPPGRQPVIFAKGVVSSDSLEHSAPVFSADGTIVLWSIVPRGKPAYLLEMRMKNGTWTTPAAPAFASSTHDDMYPSFSLDGKTLYFSSRRPLPPGFDMKGDIWIWTVKQASEGWTEPILFDTSVTSGYDYAHSMSSRGSIYFSTSRTGHQSWDIMYTVKENGKYKKPMPLNNGINTNNYEDGPYVAPDESFLIFESLRPESIAGSVDLYICFKEKDGQWGKPINMGEPVNTRHTERFARLSPDGKYLFFGSTRDQSAETVNFDLYWVNAKVIDDLKRKHLKVK